MSPRSTQRFKIHPWARTAKMFPGTTSHGIYSLFRVFTANKSKECFPYIYTNKYILFRYIEQLSFYINCCANFGSVWSSPQSKTDRGTEVVGCAVAVRVKSGNWSHAEDNEKRTGDRQHEICHLSYARADECTSQQWVHVGPWWVREILLLFRRGWRSAGSCPCSAVSCTKYSEINGRFPLRVGKENQGNTLTANG